MQTPTFFIWPGSAGPMCCRTSMSELKEVLPDLLYRSYICPSVFLLLGVLSVSWGSQNFVGHSGSLRSDSCPATSETSEVLLIDLSQPRPPPSNRFSSTSHLTFCIQPQL